MRKINEQDIGNVIIECIFDTEMENVKEMKKRPEFKEEELGDNPYVYTLSIPVTEIKSDIEYTEDEQGVIVNKTLYFEKTQKVELYMHESGRDNVANLSDKAQRLYLHILYTLERGEDYVFINKQFYMNKNNVSSQTTFYNSIKELHRYQYIQPTPIKGIFWINPHRFFPGSRLKKYPDKMEVVQTWDKTQGTKKKKREEKKPFKFNSEQEEFENDQR